MPDNKTEIKPHDASRVNLKEEYEIQYWIKKFNCSREDLTKAVEVVGTSSARIEEFLRKKL